MINKLDAVIPDWRMRLAAGIMLAAVIETVNGYLMPRGPITTTQALATTVAAFFVGLQ